jgi:hypothetical protein
MNDIELQQDLIIQVLKSIEIGDLNQVRENMININLNSTYNIEKQTARIIFMMACMSGNVDIVDELTYLTSYENDKSILNDTFNVLVAENNPKKHSVISYLVNSPKLASKRNDDFNSFLHVNLLSAACNDDLPLFKALINLEVGNDNHKSIFSIHFILLGNACADNNIDVFNYIYDYYLSLFNDTQSYGFDEACENKNINILEFLIFEKNIELSKDVRADIKLYNCEEASKMFETRELSKQLTGELPVNEESTKKVKL